jgi:hypothetical protein
MLMHAQLVSGLAPDWSFLGAVGVGDAAVDAPVVFADVLAPPQGDAVMSTNDVFVDPDTNDAHLVARTHAGAAAYYHCPPGSRSRTRPGAATATRWCASACT